MWFYNEISLPALATVCIFFTSVVTSGFILPVMTFENLPQSKRKGGI